MFKGVKFQVPERLSHLIKEEKKIDLTKFSRKKKQIGWGQEKNDNPLNASSSSLDVQPKDSKLPELV